MYRVLVNESAQASILVGPKRGGLLLKLRGGEADDAWGAKDSTERSAAHDLEAAVEEGVLARPYRPLYCAHSILNVIAEH